jgi:hypothetical protein
MTARHDLEMAIAGALDAAALDVVSTRARIIDGEWLELAAPFEDLTHTDLDNGCSLLSLNGRLSGASRVGRSREGLLEMRADAFIGTDAPRSDGHREPADLTTRLRALCADFRSAIHRLQGIEPEPSALAPGSVAQASPGTIAPVAERAGHLTRLCLDAGWPAVERASGDVSIALDAGHATYQAHVLPGNGHAFGATVPLLDAMPASPICRSAVARMLLLVSTRVRLVKGVLVPVRGAESPGVAIACAPAHSVEAIDRALSALAVACHLAGREIRALHDEELAREYLALFTETFTQEESPCLQQM